MPKISKEAAEARKNKIIQCAFEVFAENGYAQTTIDDIVTASGISKGGIYNYFKSKEEIFLEIAESRFEQRHRLIKSFPKDMSNRDKIINYIHWALIGLFEDKLQRMARFTFEFWSVLARNPNMSDKAKKRYHLFYDDLSKILKQGVDHGEFQEDIDIPSMVYIILSTMDGIGFTSCIMGIEITYEVVENYTDMILRKIEKGD
ncbi:TetR/AcrR family transcriptional regulator [Alkaliphilus sp. MSJ-5]|uniref:TetR/AcrR family transcriptional regulator n=1 Tax=Alkaliphilus flagellatus TaxID=2841507 RepID=A0ABS6G2K7_9FIRM|nr:TetR/AcrR family transcriptional regulator [Alkaliphilus flagellatus]MBU5676414.1 TetR/AcrR family transcriptional regulator [Alkaliphilus flagellatus]